MFIRRIHANQLVWLMRLIDTHCHLADAEFPLDPIECLAKAERNGVDKIILASADEDESRRALVFVENNANVWTSVGVHPHHAKDGIDFLRRVDFSHPKLVAIGETGLDYHYDFSPRRTQRQVFRQQIELALEYDLPIIFHVREAYEDFWKIVDDYEIKRAVVHCFYSNEVNLKRILAKDWMVGLNGVITFTKDSKQLEIYKNIPLDKIILETDAPYLAPVPLRGKINQPAYVKYVAKFLAQLRGLPIAELAEQTSRNAELLFSI